MTVHQLHPGTPSWWSDALTFLAEVGPIGGADLADRLEQDKSDVWDFLVKSPAALLTGDGWVNLQAAMDGAVFTHAVTPGELDSGELTITTDLALLELLSDREEELPFEGGGRLRVVCRHGEPIDAHVLAGPDGWLDSVQPDDLVTVRVVDGAVTVSPVELPDTMPERLAERITRVLDRFHLAAESALANFAAADEDERDSPTQVVEDVVVKTLIAEPDLFADPLPPLSEILRSSDRLKVVEDEVGLAVAPWDLGEVEGMGQQAILDLTMVRAWLLTGSAESGHSALDVLKILSATPVLLVRIADDVERQQVDTGRLDELRHAAPGPTQEAAAVMLAARSAERDGRPDDAADLVEEALKRMPDLAPALGDAAEYAATRGDVARADELLARAGLPARELPRSLLRQLMSLPMGVVARNQPCPCGSGVKYKKCCLPYELHPLPLRAQLVHQLLIAYAARAGHHELIQTLQMRSVPQGDSACTDLVLFEQGIAEKFLHRRGAWLRADERDLVAGWVRTPLRLYEVVSISPGREAVVRALPDGDPVVLRDRIFSENARPLDLMLARLLDDGARPALFANHFAVDRTRRAEMLRLLATEPDAYDLAAFFGPQWPLTNEDEHELAQSESSVPLGDSVDAGPIDVPEIPESITPGQLDELMGRYVREHEQRWVDEAIPALGGLTPRQAVEQGGEALAELGALLDDFEWAHQRHDGRASGSMSGHRIRGILGLRRP